MSSQEKSGITVDQIHQDALLQIATQYWLPGGDSRKPFDSDIVEKIYENEIIGSGFSSRRCMMLEFSQYLEKFLWPHFDTEKSSNEHLISIIAMVNEKFRERVPAWEPFKRNPENFEGFMRRAYELSLNENLSPKVQTVILIFLIHAFNSLEVDLIREQIQRVVKLSIWKNLQENRLEEIFEQHAVYKKHWNAIQKKDAKLDEKEKKNVDFDRSFLFNHVEKFLNILNSFPKKGEIDLDKLHYCERFLEFLIDLESQLPTRRFFNTLLNDNHFVTKCNLSRLVRCEEGKLFTQLLDMLTFYVSFEINDHTGEALKESEMIDIHYNRVVRLQKAAFKHFQELRDFSMCNVSQVHDRENLLSHLKPLSNKKLHEIASFLNLIPPPKEEEEEKEQFKTKILLEILVSYHERRRSQLDMLNELPLYPTEQIIWDENIVPMQYYNGDACLALPKLNLQFLTLHDYLLRNFHLFRLESTYEIRQDIESAVSRMKPWKSEDGSAHFGGWSRMALPLESFVVVEVAKPNIGENHPSRVRADITVNLALKQDVKSEWEKLRKHDVALLLTIRPTQPIGTQYDFKAPFIPQVGLVYVRGCEVEGLLDENGRILEEGLDSKPNYTDSKRSFRVKLDPNQYQQDITATLEEGADDVYESFNVILRRKPKENNFKAVLETIRSLMNTECVVPDWLHDIILGYGDPGSAHYSKLSDFIEKLDWKDTFLSFDHLKASFPDHKITFKDDASENDISPPFKLTFPRRDPSAERPAKRSKRKTNTNDDDIKELVVEPYTPLNQGPYPYNKPKSNQVRFTPTQVEAIKSGMQPGLTIVVGPPGTGKTDVAVQIISNIYHNCPNQRTLIVTHSNQALNQLFEKIMALDIDERHLLRLGHGEESLETDKDFSRYGRVNYVLAKRIELLEEVERLQKSLEVPGDVAYTCETAGHFYLYHVYSRWEVFLDKIRKAQEKTPEKIIEYFPYHKYFSNAPQPLFKGVNFEDDMNIAEGCFRHIRKLFQQLEEFQAFELLRTGTERARYLLIKEAKIIAMTCTHAALKRFDLTKAGFQFDNILMEEAAQILEIETFIPLLLQNPEHGHNRLKRWIMIGDHHQLPPVIKNMAFQKFSNMEQSLFSRLVRLGVPTVDLDAQGRARSSISSLYKWRYKKLSDLPHVHQHPEFSLANSGFCFDYQVINVEDFQDVGETEPNPFFYQNLGEAEYLVALYMYMRLQGYPAEKITILTTYNGQKHLIRDVIKQRCEGNPLFGLPSKVTTVDRYQGQQNDYILLSLVKTRNVGHIRDVRRLVVAMSRARLGLYIFARVGLFQNCFELTPAFNILLKRPTQLHLAPSEKYPSDRKNNEKPPGDIFVVQDLTQLANYVVELYKHRVREHSIQMQSQRQVQNTNVAEVQKIDEEETKKEDNPTTETTIDNDADRHDK